MRLVETTNSLERAHHRRAHPPSYSYFAALTKEGNSNEPTIREFSEPDFAGFCNTETQTGPQRLLPVTNKKKEMRITTKKEKRKKTKRRRRKNKTKQQHPHHHHPSPFWFFSILKYLATTTLLQL
eukprot:TRINITY_DN281_c0_g1_i1.p1 TRINITY_DN281_c0_g1~~TRINITY_DN281_c0_g1_i1.p1  ORF type:complete len:125 (-),score=26.39 TRINITY_DN281_c0_g1_i1:114-488(-)